MKTTNFFIDFLIIGFIGLITFTLPILLYFESTLESFISSSLNITSALYISIATISVYIIGIIYNQFVDIIMNKMSKILRLSEIDEKKNEIENEFETESYHSLVQLIVLNSPSSYDYLSYRRTIIRIIRALVLSSIIIIIIHLLTALIGMFIWGSLFSVFNATIMGLILLSLFLFRHTYIRLHKGYFNAIKYFAKIIREGISES